MSAVTTNPADQAFWGRSLYIRSPGYDWFWFVLSPLWAIVIGWLMTAWLFQATVNILDTTETTAFFLYMALTQAHLLITAYRTHFNGVVRQRFFWRFTTVPVLLLAAALVSNWAFTCLFVLMVFWDVYHSAMQVFGFARIYDRKAGNDPEAGRTADYLLCCLMYIGPVFAGALFLDHVRAFGSFSEVETVEIFGLLISGQGLAEVPGHAATYADEIRQLMFGATAACLLFYGWTQYRLYRNGYRMPLPKIIMFASTAVACITAWGFNSFAMGYLIANTFHAIQYFALIWVLEERSISNTLHLQGIARLLCYVAIPLAVALFLVASGAREVQALLMICALMHFWWDSFIWSVRSDQGYDG